MILPKPHDRQQEIIDSRAKRKVIRAGRRAGKTIVAAIMAVEAFRAGRRVLYATPTAEQIDRFWTTVKQALQAPIDHNYYYKNEGRHIIELTGTEQRIRAKTAYDADTLRGDYADLLILDEYQMIKPDAWRKVGAPMLLDNDGDAVFIYTTRAGKKGDHARKLYDYADTDDTGRWQAFTFSSHENPYLSEDALDDIVQDMTDLDYQMEIMAMEVDDDPDALWTRNMIEEYRVITPPKKFDRVVVGVDPPGSPGTECGIVVVGLANLGKVAHAYVIADRSMKGKPFDWGAAVVTAYNTFLADVVLGEVNYGGDMVESTIEAVVKLSGDEGYVAFRDVRATRGKAVRAEPISTLYNKGLVHHVGAFPELENELCSWVPASGMLSPNRLDALVWCVTDLLGGASKSTWEDHEDLGQVEEFDNVWA